MSDTPNPWTCDHCPAPAVVLCPGAEERLALGILIHAGRADRLWCLDCARAAGWPWLASEGGHVSAHG